MFFGVYVNDLPSTPKHCLVESYVDDTKLYMSFQPHDSGNIVAALNEDLVSTRNWCFENGLLLNPHKTKLIIYGSRQMSAKSQNFALHSSVKTLNPQRLLKILE